jgi:outer membrane protein TolC
MKKRVQSGISSKLDLLNSSKETLNFKLKLMQIQREFSEALQDWYLLIGEIVDQHIFLSPIPDELTNKWHESLCTPTAVIKILPTEVNVKISTLDLEHPQLQLLQYQIFATDLKRQSIESSYWPKLQLSLRSSLDYPNGPKLERYNQNALMLSFSMPIWDGYHRTEQINSLMNVKRSLELQKEQVQHDLQGAMQKLITSISQLEEEIKVARDGTKDAEDLAKLTYQSYINGKTKYLDVQSANVRVLEWKTQVDSLIYLRSLNVAQIEYLGQVSEEK